ncbi:MAG: FtsW/RodA/SpoVE family cell cycle protein [Oscillospiraceae bacterium]|nr:FtsW/RodA/SpoVE family cell cycle protein [Oscillospiraceae bacterium]MCI9391092.1 FtsW/RodA/SpoVE family cell cycle protein [Oscillospiraceae bacterium]
MDLPFLLLALLLLGIGLIMLLSASFPSAQASKGTNYDPLYYFKRQGIFAGLGLFAMFWVSKINYERFRGLAKLGIIVSVVLLVLVLIPGVGITRNNATRWLGVPGIDSGQFQPSEVAKVGVIVFFAEFISKKREKMSTLKEGLLPLGLLLVFVAALIGLEPHLSGAILVLGIGAAMMMVGGIHWGWIAAGVTGLCTGWYVLANTDIVESVLKYNVSRLITWKDPWWDIQDKSFQTAQSLITIGSGGLLGLGLGKGRQKFMFLPEEHNDYIFAVVFEELGLVGGTLIMVLFALLIIRGFWLAIHARDRFGSLLAVGVTTQIALQTFLNIAVVTNFIPATGISLPFFSYGGTALAIQLAEVGIVLSVSRQIPAPKAG